MAEKSKYNVDLTAEKRTYNGIVFASVLEMRFYRDVVKDLLSSGKISAADMQKVYVLQEGFVYRGKKVPPITYKADFVFYMADGKEIVIDTKGCPDDAARIKRKLFWWVYPNIDYYWVGYSKIDGGWVPWETIQKGRSQRRREKRKEQKYEKS